MSDGTTSSVGLAESASPDTEIEVSLMSDGSKRQRIDAPTLSELLNGVVFLLGNLLSRTPMLDASTGLPRSPTTAAVTVSSGTVTTVTTVSTVTACTTVGTLSNVTAIGGFRAEYDQISAMNQLVYQQRAYGIAVAI